MYDNQILAMMRLHIYILVTSTTYIIAALRTYHLNSYDNITP